MKTATYQKTLIRPKILSLFFLLACLIPVYTQTPEQWLSAMSDSLKGITSFQYKALMRSKTMGSNEFKDRYFEVYAQWNPLYDGINYRFNWHIVEHRKGKDLNFFFIHNDFYSVFHAGGFVVHNPNVHHLQQGEFFEYMRWLVFFDELTEAADSLHKGKPVWLKNTYFNGQFAELHIQIHENADRILCLNKQSLFPERVVEIVREENLNMEQVMEVHLSDIALNAPFPDSIFSPQYYMDKGLRFVPPKNPEPRKDLLTEPVHTPEFATTLIQAPLVSGNGDTVTLEKMDGEVFLIDFWYASCMPCLKALPHLQSLSEKYGPRGLKVIGLNCMDMESKASIVKKLHKKGITYPSFFSTKALTHKLDIPGFPTLVLLNKDKKLITSGLGQIANLEALIEADLK